MNNLTSTYWARNPAREVFDVGPYITREAAIEEGAELMKLAPGTVFDVGKIVPYEPTIPAATLIGTLEEQVQDLPGEAPRKWADRLPRLDSANAAELQELVETVLVGFLLRKNLLPQFGTVTDITTHTAP